MKRILSIILIVLILMLGGCTGALDYHSVILDDVTYRTGFYGDLYVMDLQHSEEPVIKDENNYYKNFYRVEDTEYDLLITYPGGINGELYCLESNWEAAKEYYENPDNFTYYCGTDSGRFELENIDIEKYEELTKFTKENIYVPFNSLHNNSVKTLTMPIPDSMEYVFYKQSKDNIFTSSKGYEFLVADGKLILLFRYNYHQGEAEPECTYVEVPENLSNYFVSLISNNSDLR